MSSCSWEMVRLGAVMLRVGELGLGRLGAVKLGALEPEAMGG